MTLGRCYVIFCDGVASIFYLNKSSVFARPNKKLKHTKHDQLSEYIEQAYTLQPECSIYFLWRNRNGEKRTVLEWKNAVSCDIARFA